MTEPKIYEVTIVRGHNWEALYIDDELYVEGCKIKLSDLTSAINDVGAMGCVTNYRLTERGNDWLDEQGEFPEFLFDIPSDYAE